MRCRDTCNNRKIGEQLEAEAESGSREDRRQPDPVLRRDGPAHLVGADEMRFGQGVGTGPGGASLAAEERANHPRGDYSRRDSILHFGLRGRRENWWS
jgi:hypothetical protein